MFESGTFDLITSISVVEHIPDDTQAIRTIWHSLRPGGRLLLTVPCSSQAQEEYIDRNEYGLLNANEEGFFFFQRYYDQKHLRRNIFSITGEPIRFSIYGEKKPGHYRKNYLEKLANPNYAYWREPYMMGREYRYFESVDQLPGIGVIGMEFVKST